MVDSLWSGNGASMSTSSPAVIAHCVIVGLHTARELFDNVLIRLCRSSSGQV